MTFLLRFWPYLLGGVAVVIGLLWFGQVRYESGYNASEAKWLPKLDVANKALLEANERTRQQEAASRALTQKAEAEHAQTLASLQVRYTDADVRIRGLVRQLSQHSRCSSVPPVPGTPAVPDGASGSSERAERAGASISDVGRRCERDAAKVMLLQQLLREQQAIH